MFSNQPLFAEAALYSAALVVLASLYTDGRHRDIPNSLVVGLAALWALSAGFAPQALSVAPSVALAYGAGALAFGYGLYALGWLGGGDGKLLAALTIWLAPQDLWLWLLATALLGSALVLVAVCRPRGDMNTRSIPFAWAMAPPAAMLLIARAVDLGSG